MALIIKSDGDDKIFGTRWSDFIFSGRGNDEVYAGGGSDFVWTGRGNDIVNGGAGADFIKTGSGDDTAIFNLAENSGRKWLWDTYDGGKGQDTLKLELTSDEWSDPDVRAEITAYFEFLKTATGRKAFQFETLKLSVSKFEVAELYIDGQLFDPLKEEIDLSGSTADEIVTITSPVGGVVTTGSGNDDITGDVGDDVIRSGAGNDTIYPGDGDDYVDAGAGNDTIIAGQGAGDDIYIGGSGNDLITFASSAADMVIDLRETDRSLYTSANFATYASLGALLSNPPAPAPSLPATTPTGFADGADTNVDALIGIERVIGGQGNDTIDGSDADNELVGANGNDMIRGHAGGDAIYGGAGIDDLSGGSGDDLLSGGANDDTIDGGTGFDTIILSGNSSDYTITRAPTAGFYTIVDNGGNGEGTDTVTQVEEIIFDDGTFGLWNFVGHIRIFLTNNDDTAFGTDARERFYGLDGDDNIQGGRASDEFVGGRGNDILNGGGVNDPNNDDDANFEWDAVLYSLEYDIAFGQGVQGLSGVSVNLTTGVATDVFGDTDTLIEIERVYGTVLDDTFIGSSGTDAFDPRGGNDIIDGGAGRDYLHYHLDSGYYGGAISAIVVNFTGDGQGTVIDTQGDTDTFFGIEIVRGTNLDDTFIGNAGYQQFRGYDGADYFDGGADHDALSYHDSANYGGTLGIDVDLTAGTVLDPWGNTDQVFNIEEIRGTGVADTMRAANNIDVTFRGEAGNDNLVGFGGDDRLLGGEGQDTLSGGAGQDYLEGGIGNDRLYGGSGDDFMQGGSGADEFQFIPGDGNDTIEDFEVGIDSMVLFGGLTVSGLSEADVDGDGTLDTIVDFSSGDSVTLLFISGIADPNDLF
ncbi:hypothetical protein [Ruegeria marisrubri]|uniref:calcium-binding protein n=1 Tax=Ruegeria marisrubri TaxID=1685379 RepID=UPI00296B533F|nr:hypothetical protein [Ruegeria marisrubri]